MRRIALLLVALLMAVNVVAEQVEISVPQADTVRLDWQAVPGQTYQVERTPSLLGSSWTNSTPDVVVASNVLGSFEGAASGNMQFFRVIKEDTDAPTVSSLLPADDAIAVVSNATVTIVLDDETGIDTNSISLSVGLATNMTLADAEVTWSSNTLTYTTTGILGAEGSVVSNSLTVSDTLGHTLSNYVWSFQLDHPTVASDAFLPLTAPPEGTGQQLLSIGGTPVIRSIPGIEPLDGTDEFHIISVTSNTVLFSYSGTPPSLSNGTRLVSFDAAYPFYRDVVSNAVDAGQLEITAWTTNVSLTALMSEGALASLDFISAKSGYTTTAQGEMNLQVEFGDNLSGKVLYDNAGVKLHLLNGSLWSFVGDVDVALDVNCGELRSLDAFASGKLTLDIKPEVLFQAAGISGDGSTPLIAPVTHVFGAMAGPVPVWVEVIMELNAGYTYNASVDGSVHTRVYAEKELTFNVQLREDEWSTGVEAPPIVFVADPIEWQIEGHANAVVYLQPKLTVLVYSLAGLWADIKPYAELDVNAQLNPVEYDAGLYLGLSTTLGIESRIWYDWWGDKPEKTFELLPKKSIWSTSYPTDIAPAFISSFIDKRVTIGSSLILSGHATGEPDPGYLWYYNGSRIVGETGPEYNISSANSGYAGTYSVMAYNSAGNVQTSCVLIVEEDVEGPSGMSYIPAGNFQMGDSFGEGWSDEVPVHTVYVSAFYMDKYEVTKGKWDQVANWGATRGYDVYAAYGSGKGWNHPVQEVTWYESVKWCNARSQMEGRTPCYTVSGSIYKTGESDDVDCNWSANGYRLPTEAEWEKAARGGSAGRRFPWGASINHNYANYRANGSAYSYDTSPYTSYTFHPDYDDGGYPYTSPVGSFSANGYGLYDMAGNVLEWCNDWHGSYPSGSVSNPHGPSTGSSRVIRGGSWYNYADYCRVADRHDHTPDGSYGNIGFRAVLTPGQ